MASATRETTVRTFEIRHLKRVLSHVGLWTDEWVGKEDRGKQYADFWRVVLFLSDTSLMIKLQKWRSQCILYRTKLDLKANYFVLFWAGWFGQCSVLLQTGRPGFDPRQTPGIFPLTYASRPALGPTQPPVQWVPGALSAGVKRGRGVTLTTHPLLVRRLRNSRSYTSSHPKRLHGV
jgi:hypothetical protein